MPTKILSIDDSRMVHMVITKTLKPFDVEVLTAVNGQEGIEKAAQSVPNLIILDATMPVMNGIECLETLKKHEATRAIPVIMLSADSGKENIDRATQLGALQFIPKPFTGDALLEAVRKYVDLPAKAA
ncbi:MAG TPA: response regulator [Methylomirabilota bacterium]|nr:response regulator [Methylomirabilota bacterium]